jgi:hypothetical protein
MLIWQRMQSMIQLEKKLEVEFDEGMEWKEFPKK